MLSIKECVDNLNKDEVDLVTELVKSSVLDQSMERVFGVEVGLAWNAFE